MALVTHPIYAKDWSFVSSSSPTSSFDAPPSYSLAESLSTSSHVVQPSAAAIQSTTTSNNNNNRKSTNKRRAQEVGLEEEGRIPAWSHAAAAPSSSAATTSSTSTSTTVNTSATLVSSLSTALTCTNGSKKAKLSDSEDVVDRSSSTASSVSVAHKMEDVFLFLVDALTNVCSPAPAPVPPASSVPTPQNQTSSPAPLSLSLSSSPLLLLPETATEVPQSTPLVADGDGVDVVDDGKSSPETTTAVPVPGPESTPEPDQDGNTALLSHTQSSSQPPQLLESPSTPRARPLKSLTPPTSPLSDCQYRAPYVRKTFVVRQTTDRNENLGRWVLAKNHFLSVRCKDPRMQSTEWLDSLRGIGWEAIHPYFQAQAEAEFEAAAAAAHRNYHTQQQQQQYRYRHQHQQLNNTLAEWIEDDIDVDAAEYEHEGGGGGEYVGEGDDGYWANEEEDDDDEDDDEDDVDVEEEVGEEELEKIMKFEAELHKRSKLQLQLQGAHTDVWDSGVLLTPISPSPTTTSSSEAGDDDGVQLLSPNGCQC